MSDGVTFALRDRKRKIRCRLNSSLGSGKGIFVFENMLG